MDLVDCPEDARSDSRNCTGVQTGPSRRTSTSSTPVQPAQLKAGCPPRARTLRRHSERLLLHGGPAMFDEFFKEYVEKEAALLDHSIYHLDGPGALCHVASICASPHLDAIQWVPGAGNKALPEWPDVLRKVQNLGKASGSTAPHRRPRP